MARADARRYVNSGGFDQELVITPSGLKDISIQGLATRHTNSFDTDGRPILADNVHCMFSELDLNALSVETRDSKGRLAIKGWKVCFADAIGQAEYKISEAHPDGTLGLIRCTLTHYE